MTKPERFGHFGISMRPSDSHVGYGLFIEAGASTVQYRQWFSLLRLVGY
jgi:hypothetical protein